MVFDLMRVLGGGGLLMIDAAQCLSLFIAYHTSCFGVLLF